jgi:hypothetical protein
MQKLHMRFPALLFFFICSLSIALAQTPTPSQPQKPLPIQDNSFLLEEAYNQEDGVVQHISFFMRTWPGRDWIYTFTQEWPVFSQKHQFSYTVPIQKIGGAPLGGTGLGDIALNYRYQLLGSGETKVAVAPRFSLLMPTGNHQKGLSTRSVGVQFNLPVSIAMSDRLVTHWNAGTIHIKSARNALGEKADLNGYNFGVSAIVLASQNFNLMLETAWNSAESITGPGSKEYEDSFVISPGFRWAHNFSSGLQIVPGIAVPIGVGPSKGDAGIIFYISFEHPFTRSDKR